MVIPLRTSLIIFALLLAPSCATPLSSPSRIADRVSTSTSSLSAPTERANDPSNGPPNFQTDPKFTAEDHKHGAVLCNWIIDLSVLTFHDQCHKNEAPEFRAALVESIDRINRFAAANSPESYEDMVKQAEQYQSRDRQSTHTQCTASAEHFYQRLKRAGPENLRQSTSRMLAVPRPPVLNPCL